MSIKALFEHKAQSVIDSLDNEREMKTVSIRLTPSEIRTADYLAKCLYTSRQGIISDILTPALHDALFGYFAGAGFTPEQAMKVQSDLSGNSSSDESSEESKS